jgi:hypothetical protein
MLEEQRWGLAILVSQKACEGPSKTHLAWGAWGGPVEKLLGDGRGNVSKKHAPIFIIIRNSILLDQFNTFETKFGVQIIEIEFSYF